MIRLTPLIKEWKQHGTIWRTNSGKIAAKNRRGKVKYFKTVADARAWSRTGTTRSSENVIPEEQEEAKEVPPMDNFPANHPPEKYDEIPTQVYQDFS